MVMASLLLFLLLATRAHGIRMDRQLHDALSSKEPAGDSKAAAQPSELAAHSASKHCASDGRCSGTATEQIPPPTAAAVAAKDTDHQVVVSAYARPVPRFHEDYYGAGGHEPNHH